jgi:hypothetical protein
MGEVMMKAFKNTCLVAVGLSCTASLASAKSPFWRYMIVLACLLFTSLAQAAMPIRSGHAGHWFAAERSGEGWVLELRDAGDAWLYWFTYDGQGRQRWLTAAGQIVDDGNDGQRIDFAQLVVTRGARFGAAFNPADVVREAVGSASFRFDTCDSGQFSYSAYGQNQTFNVQRLARVMGTRCETPHGVTGREVADHAGQSGSWYDTTHNGEGYALHWATPDQAIVTWYSYDTQGNQYWMLGTGQLDSEGRIHFPDVHATRGARFGAAFDPDDVERFEWGTLTFELACDGGSAHYQSVLPAFGSGDFDLTRLTSLREVACPWHRPKLTELYDIDVRILPSDIEGHPNEQALAFHARMDDDGAIWTTQSTIGYRLLFLPVNADAWQLAGEHELSSERYLGLRGNAAIANGRLPGMSVYTQPILYADGAWQPLDPSLTETALFTATSRLSERVLGITLDHQNRFVAAWHWDAEHGEAVLPMTSETILPATGLTPVAANEDGSLIFGMRDGFIGPQQPRAVHRHMFVWRNGGDPERMLDANGWALASSQACNVDCSIVFGSAANDLNATNPLLDEAARRNEPWVWFSDTEASRYLGQLDLSSPSPPTYSGYGTSPDGSLLVGAYGIYSYLSSAPDAAISKSNADRTQDTFIWTPLTGMVSIGRVFDELGAEPASWRNLDLSAVSPSARSFLVTEGRTFLSGEDRDMAIVTLRPRAGY